MKRFYLLALLVFFAHTSWAARYLFVLHSLGETNGLIPVMEKLDDKDYDILAFGKAFEKLKNHPRLIRLSSHMLEVSERLPESVQCHLNTMKDKPKVVLVGMASRAQANVLDLFKSAHRVVFYDNFDSPHVHWQGYLQYFYGAFGGADVLLVPGKVHIEGAHKLKKFSHDGFKVLALGQPSLESWDKIYAETNTKDLRSKLGIEAYRKVILYAGGFDPKDKGQYEEDLTHFIRAASFFDGVEVLVTYHPKTDGALEKNIVKKLNAPNIRVIEKGTFSTAVLSTIASVVVCFKSTVGAQAAYMGKPVLYIARGYENFLTQSGVAELDGGDRLLRILKKLLNSTASENTFCDVLGIPKNASQRIAKYLKDL